MIIQWLFNDYLMIDDELYFIMIVNPHLNAKNSD